MNKNFEDMRVFGSASQLAQKTLSNELSPKDWPPLLLRSLQEEALDLCASLGRFHVRYERQDKLDALQGSKECIATIRSALILGRTLVKNRDAEQAIAAMLQLSDDCIAQICGLAGAVANPDRRKGESNGGPNQNYSQNRYAKA